MKSLIVIFVSLITTSVFSQWSQRKIDNGLDTPYVIGYVLNSDGAYLKLENYNGVAFYISGIYICDDIVKVELAFNVSGSYHKYEYTCNVSDDNETVFILDDMGSDEAFLNHFKSASLIRLRIHDQTCDTEMYEFSMINSSSVYNAVLKQ
jgi:hypothetical protein